MGKQIVARFSDRYDFYFLPDLVLARRPDLLRAMIPAVDAIHCLNESSMVLFRNYDPAALPPIATWIHHVTVWSEYLQAAIDRSSALTVCTGGWKQYLDRRVSGRIPVTVIPHGVDTAFFQRTIVPPARFGIPPGSFVLGFVGSKGSDADFGRKGTGILLDVVRKAASRLPNLHVVLGGPGWEKMLSELRAFGVSASATGYIRKSDLPALYSALDVYLLTSRVEGGPCTVFEAMSCGTAVVSTRVGVVPELIVDGVNGYSANVDDSDALLDAILTLAQSPAHRMQIAANGQITVSHRSWENVLTPLEAVYSDLIHRPRTLAPPLPGPAWMNDPPELLRVSCAADSLAHVASRVLKRSIGPVQGIRLLREMLDHQPLSVIPQGLFMLTGASYRP
jgi:glycosyltransferase involved in cell wall biosynthesis